MVRQARKQWVEKDARRAGGLARMLELAFVPTVATPKQMLSPAKTNARDIRLSAR
jgi:hypothetical protein